MVGLCRSPKQVPPAWSGWVVWLVILVGVQPMEAQVSVHQRIGVESRAYWEADIELATNLTPYGYDDYRLYSLDSSLSFGLLLGRRWSVSLVFPFCLYGYPDSHDHYWFNPGDVAASMGWTARAGDNRLRCSLHMTIPSAVWLGNQEIPGAIAGGSGRWTLGLSGGVTRIVDPLVLGGQVSWSVGLPRAERWGSLWRPGDFSLALSVTEAFNEHISCSAVLTQYTFLPEAFWGSPMWASSYKDKRYDAVVRVSVLVSGSSFNWGVDITKGLVHASDPGSVSLSVAYILRQKEGS